MWLDRTTAAMRQIPKLGSGLKPAALAFAKVIGKTLRAIWVLSGGLTLQCLHFISCVLTADAILLGSGLFAPENTVSSLKFPQLGQVNDALIANQYLGVIFFAICLKSFCQIFFYFVVRAFGEGGSLYLIPAASHQSISKSHPSRISATLMTPPDFALNSSIFEPYQNILNSVWCIFWILWFKVFNFKIRNAKRKAMRTSR